MKTMPIDEPDEPESRAERNRREQAEEAARRETWPCDLRNPRFAIRDREEEVWLGEDDD